MLCFVETAFTDKVPRRFWGKEKYWNKEGGPDPLDRKGDFVAPFSGVVYKAFQNSGGYELTDDEAPWTY